MAGSGSGGPPGMDPRASDLGMLLNTARAVVDGEDSGADNHDAAETDEVTVFNYFNRFPSEIRTMIWLAAAEAAKPCGIYHFTFKPFQMRPGLGYPDVCDTVLANLYRAPSSRSLSQSIHDLLWWAFYGKEIYTFTPSAAVAKMTLPIRDLLRSCPEARAELIRFQKLGASFKFHYLKGGKCNLGTIRPFFYETDWISMDGLDHDISQPMDIVIRRMPDIQRIQHFAFPYGSFNPRKLFRFYRRGSNSVGGCRGAARIFRWLNGLKSVGLYAPSFNIKRVRHWDKVISQNERLFLKCLLPPIFGPVSTPSWNAGEFNKAMIRLTHLVLLMGCMEMQKTKERWPAITCDFAALQFCFIFHVDNRKGLDLMRFKEDGSHLDGVNMDDLGKIGSDLEWLSRAGDPYR